MKRYDVLVRGSGIVGQSLALALARLGLRVALRAEGAHRADNADPVRREGRPDVRAYALSATSVSLLQSLKVWDALPKQAATPVHDMRIEGDSSGGLVEFSAWEARVGELAHIVDAAVLERELASAVRFAPHVTVVDTDDVQAPLTALCEGKTSSAHEIASQAWLKSWCQQVPMYNSEKAGVRARETSTLVGAPL